MGMGLECYNPVGNSPLTSLDAMHVDVCIRAWPDGNSYSKYYALHSASCYSICTRVYSTKKI
jgi:hypothetical protein